MRWIVPGSLTPLDDGRVRRPKPPVQIRRKQFIFHPHTQLGDSRSFPVPASYSRVTLQKVWVDPIRTTSGELSPFKLLRQVGEVLSRIVT